MSWLLHVLWATSIPCSHAVTAEVTYLLCIIVNTKSRCRSDSRDHLSLCMYVSCICLWRQSQRIKNGETHKWSYLNVWHCDSRGHSCYYQVMRWTHYLKPLQFTLIHYTRRAIGAAMLMHFQASPIIIITRQFVLTTVAIYTEAVNVVNA